MRRDLGELPRLAIAPRARLGRRGDRQRRLQVLADRNEFREPRVARIRTMPSSVKKARDTDQVTNGLGWKRARHASRERQRRLGVNASRDFARTSPDLGPTTVSLWDEERSVPGDAPAHGVRGGELSRMNGVEAPQFGLVAVPSRLPPAWVSVTTQFGGARC